MLSMVFEDVFDSNSIQVSMLCTKGTPSLIHSIQEIFLEVSSIIF